jgi:hypothetical protein
MVSACVRDHVGDDCCDSVASTIARGLPNIVTEGDLVVPITARPAHTTASGWATPRPASRSTHAQ